MPTPPLTTDRLEIRSLRADDADGLHRVFGDPEAMRYVGPNGRARTRTQTAENVARFMAAERDQGFGLWAATRCEDGRMIGGHVAADHADDLVVVFASCDVAALASDQLHRAPPWGRCWWMYSNLSDTMLA